MAVSDWESPVRKCTFTLSGQYYDKGDHPILVPFWFWHGHGNCAAIAVGVESGCPAPDLWLEKVDSFPDRGGRLSCNLYERFEWRAERLAPRCHISTVRFAPGRSVVHRHSVQCSGRSSKCLVICRAAEESVEGDEDWHTFWIVMNDANCGNRLSGEEGVVVQLTLIEFFWPFLLPLRGLRSSSW